MAEEDKNLGINGIPMELPIVQYNIIDIFSGLSPAVCPRCLWRGLIETPSEFLAEDFFCQECLKNNEEVGLVGDIHWEAKNIVLSIEAAVQSDSNIEQFENPSYTEDELKKWWKAYCPKCGWKGLSRDCNGGNPLADTGDYSDVVCPICDSIVEDD